MEVDSILDSIKQMLGIDYKDWSFDTELTIFINGALMVINQLGIGVDGFLVQDQHNLWSEFLEGQTGVELVKTAVYLRVRLAFDPPQNSFLVAAIKEQIAEYEWRIMNSRPNIIPTEEVLT